MKVILLICYNYLLIKMIVLIACPTRADKELLQTIYYSHVCNMYICLCVDKYYIGYGCSMTVTYFIHHYY